MHGLEEKPIRLNNCLGRCLLPYAVPVQVRFEDQPIRLQMYNVTVLAVAVQNGGGGVIVTVLHCFVTGIRPYRNATAIVSPPIRKINQLNNEQYCISSNHLVDFNPFNLYVV